MSGEKFLGNTKTNEVHDLTREKLQCRIDEIVFNEQEKPFSTLDKAHGNGYKDCQYCIEHAVKTIEAVKETSRYVYK